MRQLFLRYTRLLSAYLAPQAGSVALLAALVFGSSGLQLLGPYLIGRFIDNALSDAPAAVLSGAALLYLLVAVGQRSAGLGAVFVSERIGWRATNALRTDLVRHVLTLDLAFHKQHTPGALIERLDGDVTALANFFAQFSVRVLGNLLLIGGILAALAREDGRIALGLGLYALLCLAVLGALQRLGVRSYARAVAADTQAYGFLEERLSGTEDLRANGAEASTLHEYGARLDTQLQRARAARLTGNLTSAVTAFFAISGYAIGLGLGAWLFLSGSAGLGSAYLVVAYVGMLAAPLDQIRAQAQDLQQAGAAIERIEQLRATQPSLHETARATLPAGPLALTFDQVRFSYAAAEHSAPLSLANAPAPAADSVWRLPPASFTLPPGTTLGLLGRTGSGKSTLAQLILRLYEPQSGLIRLGGVDLRDLPVADLRRRVGMVSQEVQLFGATVRDNLRFFDPTIDDAQLEVALRELGLWEWVQRLPDGLDTPLGGAYGLSAGEAQLLAFARVLLKNPGLVILDEAGSRLDPATEQALERAVDGLLADRTAIIIAHRLATVQRADLIMILDQGQIVEVGPREALAADPSSRFARLLRTGLTEALA